MKMNLEYYLNKIYNEKTEFDLANANKDQKSGKESGQITIYQGSVKDERQRPIGNIIPKIPGQLTANEVAILLEKVRTKFSGGNVITDGGIKNFVVAYPNGIKVKNNVLELDLIPPRPGSAGEIKIIDRPI